MSWSTTNPTTSVAGLAHDGAGGLMNGVHSPALLVSLYTVESVAIAYAVSSLLTTRSVHPELPPGPIGAAERLGSTVHDDPSQRDALPLKDRAIGRPPVSPFIPNKRFAVARSASIVPWTR